MQFVTTRWPEMVLQRQYLSFAASILFQTVEIKLYPRQYKLEYLLTCQPLCVQLAQLSDQCHCCSLCGSWRVPAGRCYQPLHLHWYSPHWLSRGLALVMGSSGNPNPHYSPHYSKLHNGDLFPGLNPFPRQIRQTFVHMVRHIYMCAHMRVSTHARIGILKCTLCPCWPLFIPAGSHSQIPGLVIRCPWLFVSSFMLKHKGRFLLVHLLYAFNLSSPSTLPLISQCHIFFHHITHYSFFYEKLCVKMFEAPCCVILWSGKFPGEATKGQQWLLLFVCLLV